MSGIRDGVSDLAPTALIEPLSHVAGVQSAALDTVEAAATTLVVQTGDTVDGGATFVVEEADAPGGPWAVPVEPENDLIGDTIPTPLLPDTVYRVGYVGNKQFVRVNATIPGATKLSAAGLLMRNARTPVEDL